MDPFASVLPYFQKPLYQTIQSFHYPPLLFSFSSILLSDFSSLTENHECQKYVLSRPPTHIEQKDIPKTKQF